MTLSLRRNRYLIAASAILLLGFALRLYRLGAANVWWDEAFSVWLARQPVLDGVRVTARDVHPPLFYILLHAMMRLAGDSEFSARYFSLLAGILTVALLFPLGRRLLGRRSALLGASLLALSRFHIWWSQEIRMYTLAAAWVTLAFYLLLRQVSPKRQNWLWLPYALSLLAALHTLYLAALAIPALALAALILWRSGRMEWPVVRSWILATVAALLLFLPWVLSADPSRPGQVAGDMPAHFILSLYLTLLSTGNSAEIGRYALAAWLYGTMAGFLLLALIKGKRWTQVAFLASPLLVPLLLAYLMTLARYQFYTPALEARYFLLFAPLNALLPAAAVAWLARRWRWAGAALATGLLLLATIALPPHYDGRILRDQWKSAARIINAYAAPGDRVAIVSADRYPLFLYEYDRLPGERPPVHLLPDGVPTLTPENVASQMGRATGPAGRVWLAEIEAHMQDPGGLARSWLDTEMTELLSAQFDHNRLALYAPTDVPPAVSPERLAPQIPLERGALLGVDLPVREFRPGDTVHLGVYTTSDGSEIRLVHRTGLTLAGREIPPNPPGSILRHDLAFPVTQATPRDDYTLMAGDLALVSLRVSRSDPLLQEADIARLLAADLGDSIQLLGFELTPAEPTPGDQLQLDLFWRAQSPVDHRYTVFTQIVGPFNPATGTPVWGQHDGPPVDGTFPTEAWPAGLIIRDSHTLDLAAEAPPAIYTLIVGMYDPATGDRLPVAGNPNGAVTLLEFETP